MSNISISLMEISDIKEAARVLSLAMLDNPMHVAVFQNAGEKARVEIEKDFTGLLMERPGVVFLAKKKQEIIGVMRMNSCSGKETAGEIKEPEDENDIAARKEFWMNQWDRRDPKDQHWHLGPIGVLPAHQGAGAGSMLMERFCAEVDACGAYAFLETDKDVNVDFYNKFGFETVSETMILGVRSVFMRRAASAAGV